MDERELMERSLREGLPALGLALDGEQISRLLDFGQAVLAQNRVMNLTAVTDPADFARLHLLDSLALLPAAELDGCSLLDVGTGAGFPGVPLALLRGDIRLTLLDSLNKRLTFLDALCRALALPVTLIHARAEEGGQRADLRERFDVATARAVAALPVLCEYCLPFVRVGGIFIALKGPDAENEAAAAAYAVGILGARVAEVRETTLSADGETLAHCLVSLDKVKQTPPKYPRNSAKIAKQPL